jgi:arylsulfatase A-like enzyme
MSDNSPGLRSFIGRGAVQGAAAWSAYAVVEFVFSSLVFGMTRPYATFTSWHWSLTATLMLGFLAIGLLAGALAGLVVYVLRNTLRGLARNNGTPALESAAALTLVIAFLANLTGKQGLQNNGIWLLAAALCFAALLVAAMVSAQWMDRLGFLTNCWVISGVLLGMGQELGLLSMGMAQQMGARTGLWSTVLVGLLAITIGASIFPGRALRRRVALSRRWQMASGLAALCGVVLIFAASIVLGSAQPAHGRAVAASVLTSAANSTRPNIVLIVMDTVRADHLSVHGYERDTTPYLKALAQDAAVYGNTISASDFTLTSHASLFTGMYPSWHGAYCQPPEAVYGRELTKQFPTVAELLKSSGYATLGVAANLYLRADFGLERGFEYFQIPRPVPLLPADSGYLLRRGVRRVLSYGFDTAQFDRLYSLGEDIDEELFSALDRRGVTVGKATASRPFFAFLNYMDAHFPYVAPAPFDRKFPGRRPRIIQDDLEAEQEQITAGRPAPTGYRPHTVSQYDGGIAYVDAQIGKVVEWLKQHNAYDNTMIVVTADHGEAFGERNHIGHANSAYQNLLHIPLVIKYPHGEHRGAENHPVSLIDVAPTILTTVGVPVPQTMQGRNLTGAGANELRHIFSETFPCPVMHPPECPNGCTSQAIFPWPYKYIVTSNGSRELFDVGRDPDEVTNLAIRLEPQARQLNADLNLWMKIKPAQSKQKHKLDAEQVKNLKSLGYVQ